MRASTMLQVPGRCEDPTAAGFWGEASAPLNLPRTARAYFWGPCVLYTLKAFTCRSASHQAKP
jgi:hypothetical protein